MNPQVKKHALSFEPLQAEYRGVVNYYLLAQDVSRLGTLCWTALTSMLKTLAAKHKSTVAKMAARFTAKAITADGPRTCFEARTRRETPQARQARGHHRPRPGPGHRPAQRADLPAPQAAVRAMRARRHGGSPPGHLAHQPRQARTGPARVGRPHGQDAAQDTHRLQHLP
jgi:hypothetical protein